MEAVFPTGVDETVTMPVPAFAPCEELTFDLLLNVLLLLTEMGADDDCSLVFLASIRNLSAVRSMA